MIQDLWNGLLDVTGPLIVPDWGSLIGLLPLGLAALVALYLVTTVYRFATAGPTHRGVRRLEPIPPAGIHMPGPSFAPLLGAIGLFMLMFGLIAHGPWLLVGLAVLGVTLLYWGREALRDYDHVAAADGGAAVGLLSAPEGTPPAGVHMPPPSFRPLLLAVSMTILVGGMVVGGWGLLFGIVALALALVGWLRDAKREYRAVEAADLTGHLDLGGGPAWPTRTFAVLALLIAVTALLTSGILPNSHPATAGASPAANGGAGGGAASAAPSGPAADAAITAHGIAFTTTAVDVPAGKAFTIAFDNQDAGTPHNIEIKDASGKSVFKGDIVTGPIVKVYNVPSLPAGAYTFACTVHPNMTGTITVK
jgi:plastocyanin